MKKKNILIIGGMGFIGQHVTELFRKKKFNITILDIKIPYKNRSKDIKYIKGSVEHQKTVQRAMKKIDYVFHFAGESDIYRANKFPLQAVKKNILGTSIVLDQAVKNNVKRFMFASSIYVFSEQGGVYRTTKQACELLIENYSQIYGLKYTNLRFGSLYGIKSNNSNFIHKMINDANTTGRMIRNGDGSEIRNYINVKDVAKYCCVALKRKYENKNIMILGKERKSIRQVLNLIKSKISKNIKIDYTGERDFAHYKTSPFTFKKRKIEYLYEFDEISFEEGIKEIIDEINYKNEKKSKD